MSVGQEMRKNNQVLTDDEYSNLFGKINTRSVRLKVDWIKKTKKVSKSKMVHFCRPIYPVKKAIITHGHADHARAGHGHV